MGRYHQDGYSAEVEGFLVVGEQQYRLAKTNEQTFYLAESCIVPSSTEAELRVVVDGSVNSLTVTLPTGITAGQVMVEYTVAAPF